MAYDTISYEPIINVYQTLVTYNGSSTASFVPELSTCVPGPGCAAMYSGNTLIVNNGHGLAAVLHLPNRPGRSVLRPGDRRPAGRSTRRTWRSRSRGRAASPDLPGFGAQPGWIQCQALLPHRERLVGQRDPLVFNNTPQNILGSMLINDSTYCPSAALAANGCVTFNAWGGGAAWPFFLELVADPLGAGIEPCGWFTAQGAAVPGFAGTTGASGGGRALPAPRRRARAPRTRRSRAGSRRPPPPTGTPSRSWR